ncbi:MULTISPECIES: YceD family protein [Cyanophyceae]|uniref:YceD family protein n=1 Tax=Cyanophyceae TaxID=3028117 RepID=UPI001689DF14|nr:YceD family protein [Trichocoleus sp. FACHB-40]MBD2006568.1 DUF177 domain-containing protein [Trichocoleus sp. FACHB-40]
MKTVYIPGLTKAPERTEVIEIDEFLPELETLTPVRGQIKVTHQGNYLEVSAVAEAITTLTCHRCLQQYNHRLALNTSEMIWLDEAAEKPDSGPLERETPLEDLVEMLSPYGDFHPDVWLYEQLCLAIPPRNLCDKNCSGIQAGDKNASEMASDRRWEALEALKRQLPK